MWREEQDRHAEMKSRELQYKHTFPQKGAMCIFICVVYISVAIVCILGVYTHTHTHTLNAGYGLTNTSFPEL